MTFEVVIILEVVMVGSWLTVLLNNGVIVDIILFDGDIVVVSSLLLLLMLLVNDGEWFGSGFVVTSVNG